MFQVFDATTFGEYMKKVRKSLNLTQKDVENLCKINVETLRRLENGKVIPKYDTIEYLSEVYKADLLSVFSAHRTSEVMYKYYKDLDDIIINYDLKKVSNLQEELNKVLTNKELDNMVNLNQVDQLKEVIVGVKAYYEENYLESIESFIKALKINNKEFSIESFKAYKYTLLESRILIMLAVSLSAKKEYDNSNDLLTLALKQLINVPNMTINYVQLIIKIYLNLSYNHFNLNDLKQSLKFSNTGIKYCMDYNSIYCLFAFYYRSGVAKYLLGKRNYKNDFRYCLTLLEIQDKKDLIEIYKKRTYEMYKIEI
ncbi:MAG: helix-turn-helix transcriptional regulator [Clostridiales bacterium]|nr:helix-turn-helix transcriptional regulator [Clostridiales bacterium]